MPVHPVIVSVLVGVAALAVSASAQADCAQLAEAVQAASQAGKLDVLKELQSQVGADATCDAGARAALDRRVARAFTQAALQIADPEQREQALEQALRLGRPWQTLAHLADLKLQHKRHAAAAALYLEALGLIEDGVGVRPPAETVARLRRLATEARLLVPEAQIGSLVRCGQAVGAVSRGCQSSALIVPVRFEPGSERFLPSARALLQDVAETLTARGAPALRIVGHTDPEGSAPDNLALSRRRAEAVKRVLREVGYRGALTAEGRGATEPFQPVEAEAYTPEERHQLCRRVEIVVDERGP